MLALTDNLVAILMLAVFIGLPVALVLGGYTGTFFNALYVQFYFRLVEPPQRFRDGADGLTLAAIQRILGRGWTLPYQVCRQTPR